MVSVFGSPVYSEAVDSAAFSRLLDSVLSEKTAAVVILCCDQGSEQRDFFNTILPLMDVPVFGGIFPAVLLGEQVYERGMIMISVHVPVEIKVYHDLENAPSNQFDFSFNLPNCLSAMVLVDGLSRHIDYALNQLFQHFGQSLKVFGGGAGSLSFEQKPCLFSNQGVFADAMLVMVMQQSWELAIGHGWEVLEGPFLANQVDDNRIIQLNFAPAIDVYKDVVERHDGRLFEQHDFFELAKTYPFGLERLDDDLLVRDPVTVENTSLVCVGKVPENTMLYILKGQSDNLVLAAVDAVKQTMGSHVAAQGLLFDCISRQMFLEAKFSQELQGIALALGQTNLPGVLVLGEIASGLSGGIHFHNKTAVTAIVSKD